MLKARNMVNTPGNKASKVQFAEVEETQSPKAKEK
jgi:hypothetical protein